MLTNFKITTVTFEDGLCCGASAIPAQACYCCCAITRALWQEQQQQFRMHLHNSGSY